MSQERLDYVVRPMAYKLMDLTLGRYQVLEHHRHRIAEFIMMCQSDVEAFLMAFSKMDVERMIKDARLSIMANTRNSRSATATGDQDGESGDNLRDELADARHIQQLDEEEEAARIRQLTPEAYIAELQTQCQRQKTTEMFLRSTLSDLLNDLQKQNTSLDTQAGLVVKRNERLAKQREAFLRENQQLREIIAQFRETGRCDLPDPILYEWDAEDVAGGSNSKDGSSITRGKGGPAAADSQTQLKQQFTAEKEALEKNYNKQLEESKFRLRTMEAQFGNVARAKLEATQLVASLQAQLAELRLQQQQQQASDMSRGGGDGEGSDHHASSSEAPVAAVQLATPSNYGPSVSANPSYVKDTSISTPTFVIAGHGVDAAVQTDAVAQQAHGGVASGASGSPLHAVNHASAFTMEVDPTLQDVLVARQHTPDGLGTNVIRSTSTTAGTPQSNKALTSPTQSVRGGGATSTSGKALSKLAPPSTAVAAPRKAGKLNSPVVPAPLLVHTPDTALAVAVDDDTIGTSPWADEPSRLSVAAVLETSAHTPSQLERVKEHERANAAKISGGDNDTAAGGGVRLTNKDTVFELERLRAENAKLRSAVAGPVIGSSVSHNTTLLLKQLKQELHEKSALLQERSVQLEQLKMETMRWFDAYKRGIPPPNVATVESSSANGEESTSMNSAATKKDVVINYQTAVLLKKTVTMAEASEERYRVLSWKLLHERARYLHAVGGQINDCKEAQKNGDTSGLCVAQRQLDIIDSRMRHRLVHLRQVRAAARLDANRLWDHVVVLSRKMFSLDAVTDEDMQTPRFYSGERHTPRRRGVEPVLLPSSEPMDTNSTKRNTFERTKVEVVDDDDDDDTRRVSPPVDPHSIYFRAINNAAASYTVQTGGSSAASTVVPSFAAIPMRGVTAAAPPSLLPQRPRSAGATTAVSVGATSFPSKIRATVNRPSSAIMLSKTNTRNPTMDSCTPHRPVESSSPCRSGVVASVDIDSSTFNPAALRATASSSERRAMIMAAMSRDKANAARDRKSLAEERYAFRAQACATMPPDMAPAAGPLIHMSRLIGKCETL